MDELVSLSQTKVYLQFSDGNNSDDPTVLDFVRRASRAIVKQAKREFLPRRRTLKVDLPEDRKKIKTNFDILELKGLSDQNGARGISVDSVFLKAGEDYNLTPYNTVKIASDSGSSFNFVGTEEQAVWMDVVEGFREHYDLEAWVNTNLVVTASLTETTSTLNISASTGFNNLGETPQIRPQTVIRLNDEFAYVNSVLNASQLHIIRGVRGTTASSHASGIQVDAFVVEPEISFLTLRLAAWGYTQQSNPFGNTLATPQFGMIEVPASWPEDVKERLKKYTIKTLANIKEKRGIGYG
jgi:hypothetical protein